MTAKKQRQEKTIIFSDQKDINLYLSRGGDINNIHNDNIITGDLCQYDTGEYPDEDEVFFSYMGRRMIISDYGTVLDADTLHEIVPVLTTINNNKELAIPFKNSSNRTVYKRVAHIVAMAFLKDKCPSRIKKKIDDPYINWLKNIKTKDDNCKEANKTIVRTLTPFFDREEWEAFCFHNGLSNYDDVKSFFEIEDHEYLELNPNKFDINPKDHALISKSVVIYGTKFRIDVIGRLYKAKVTKGVVSWTHVNSVSFNKGTKSVRVYCENGKIKYITIANLMARAFYSLEERRNIKHVDGIKSNLYIHNLWWKGCGFGY